MVVVAASAIVAFSPLLKCSTTARQRAESARPDGVPHLLNSSTITTARAAKPAPRFMRLTRPQLVFGAMALTTLCACLPVLPASAEVVHEEAVAIALVEAPPAFVAPMTTAAALPAVTRDSYTVSNFSLVRSPVAPGTPILANFGPRAVICSGCSAMHSGTDFSAPAGSAVVAITNGTVSEVGPDSSLGTFVKLEHVIDGRTITSTYAHMVSGSMPFHVGDVVAGGTQLGLVGMTGIATAPHLHFEIRLGGPFGTAVNALPWLKAHINA